MNQTLGPKPREGYVLWLIKMLTAVLILILLGVHLIINHLIGAEGLLSYADIIRMYKLPFIPIMEAIFLITVVTHAFIGLRSILLDLNFNARVQKWIDRVLVVAGAFLILYGAAVLVIVASKPLPG
jgi:succinate dehydrogenase hydrophobic anchor subunit